MEDLAFKIFEMLLFTALFITCYDLVKVILALFY